MKAIANSNLVRYNSTLRVLTLKNNRISSTGAMALEKALEGDNYGVGIVELTVNDGVDAEQRDRINRIAAKNQRMIQVVEQLGVSLKNGGLALSAPTEEDFERPRRNEGEVLVLLHAPPFEAGVLVARAKSATLPRW